VSHNPSTASQVDADMADEDEVDDDDLAELDELAGKVSQKKAKKPKRSAK
jgi:hypothetical protein